MVKRPGKSAVIAFTHIVQVFDAQCARPHNDISDCQYSYLVIHITVRAVRVFSVKTCTMQLFRVT